MIAGVRQLAHEPDLHLLAQDELEHLLGVARADDQVDVRKRLLEAAEDEREDVGRDRRSRADEKLADVALAQLTQQLAALGQGLERALGVRSVCAALCGESHASRRAHEQLDPELPLELLDPRRQGGLCDVEDRGGGADGAALGDGHESLDLREEHMSILTCFIG